MMKDYFGTVLFDELSNNKDIIVVTGDCYFPILQSLQNNFPQQIINVGIAEQAMIGIAAGIAKEGKIVFTISINNFTSLRCLEQIRNDIAYHQFNVKIISLGGGFSYSHCGWTHHGTEDLACLRGLPIEIIAPCDKWEVIHATRAITHKPGPSYLRLDEAVCNDLAVEKEKFILGAARVIEDGYDLTLIGCGSIMQEVIKAASILKAQNISTRIISMHTINPIDKDTIIKAAKETGGIITVEEHSIKGGLGGAVGEVCLEHNTFPGFFYSIGLRESFTSAHGSQAYLRSYHQMDAQAIVAAAFKMIGSARTHQIKNNSTIKWLQKKTNLLRRVKI